MFLNIERLSEMEKLEKWEEIRVFLLGSWKKEKNNIDLAIRLGTECWYILSLWDCYINNENLVWDNFQDSLIEVTNYGLKNYNDDVSFLCIFGYMISILPYLFYKEDLDKEYEKWEEKGRQMIKIAHQKNPNHQLVKVMYLAMTNNVKGYKKARIELLLHLPELFPGNSYIEEYFKDIYK